MVFFPLSLTFSKMTCSARVQFIEQNEIVPFFELFYPTDKENEVRLDLLQAMK